MFDAACCFGRVEVRELVSVSDVCSWGAALETRGISCSSGDVVPNLNPKKQQNETRYDPVDHFAGCLDKLTRLKTTSTKPEMSQQSFQPPSAQCLTTTIENVSLGLFIVA